MVAFIYAASKGHLPHPKENHSSFYTVFISILALKMHVSDVLPGAGKALFITFLQFAAP
jgi:hypothetical protein